MNIFSNIIRWLEFEKSFRIECSYDELNKFLFEMKNDCFIRMEVKKGYFEYDYFYKNTSPAFGQPGSIFSCEKSSEVNGSVEIHYRTKYSYMFFMIIPLVFVILFNLIENPSADFRILFSLGVLFLFWTLQSFSLRHISRLQFNGLKRDLNLLIENSKTDNAYNRHKT